MKIQTLLKKYLSQNQDIEVLVPNYKEPILPVNHGGSGWYGLMAYNGQGQLMCHECSAFPNPSFFDDLSKHIRKHSLTSVSYKRKYGLMSKTKLISQRASAERRSIYIPDAAKARENIAKASLEKRRWRHSITEQYNLSNSCPGQLISRLLQLAQKYGDSISSTQVNAEEPSLVSLLQNRFGSFNKAKQIAKLISNPQPLAEPLYTKHLILEDMVAFYNKNGTWPTTKDYENHLLICSFTTLHRQGGGIKPLRDEARKLKEKQEMARIKGERLPLIANNIELEFAGTARR